jgi:hypothetical protein
VRVVAASVHHPDFMAIVLGPGCGFEGEIALFRHRQGIHIRAECNDPAGFAAAQKPNHTRMSDTSSNVETEPPKLVGHDLCGPHLLVRKLGVLVKVTSVGNDFWHHSRCNFIDRSMQPADALLLGVKSRRWFDRSCANTGGLCPVSNSNL